MQIRLGEGEVCMTFIPWAVLSEMELSWMLHLSRAQLSAPVA